MKDFGRVTLVTPTRDRPEAFALCARWMSRQTFRGPVQWIIVDDGDAPADFNAIRDLDVVREKWEVLHVDRDPSKVVNTLPQNMLAALAQDIRGDVVLVIEDDDWYAPVYVEEMAWRLRSADLVGEARARYYNVQERRYGTMENNKHASFCRTGIRASLVPSLRQVAEAALAADDPFLDMRLWGAMPVAQLPWGSIHASGAPQTSAPVVPRPSPLPPGAKKTLFENRGISVGIKGLPGRGGLGKAHGSRAFKNLDPEWVRLYEWLGPDALPYIDLANERGWKFVP